VSLVSHADTMVWGALPASPDSSPTCSERRFHRQHFLWQKKHKPLIKLEIQTATRCELVLHFEFYFATCFRETGERTIPPDSTRRCFHPAKRVKAFTDQ